nr:MAG TPA: hypothetical protein [Caudoviricetes sp.]
MQKIVDKSAAPQHLFYKTITVGLLIWIGYTLSTIAAALGQSGAF